MPRIRNDREHQAWLATQPGGVARYCKVCAEPVEPRRKAYAPAGEGWRHRDTIVSDHDPEPTDGN